MDKNPEAAKFAEDWLDARIAKTSSWSMRSVVDHLDEHYQIPFKRSGFSAWLETFHGDQWTEVKALG